MIRIEPANFTKVEYDADELVRLATAALAIVPALGGVADLEVRVDEDQATTRAAVVSLDPMIFAVDSGALENLKDPRRTGELESTITFVKLFLEVLDRRSEAFGAPDLNQPISHAHRIAWDVNLFGRVGRFGLRLHPPRFRYDFRNRHGFSDAADRAFDALWTGEGLSFARIVQLSDQAADTLGSDLP
jgi:hypothetical protein